MVWRPDSPKKFLEESTGTDVFGQGKYVISQLDPNVQGAHAINALASAVGANEPYSEGQIESYTDVMNTLGALTALYYGGAYALGGGEAAGGGTAASGAGAAEGVGAATGGGEAAVAGGGATAGGAAAGGGTSTATWVGLGAQGLGSLSSYYGAKEASEAAQAGQEQAAQLTREQLAQQQKQYEELLALGIPYRAAGAEGLGKYLQYTKTPELMYQDPAYQAMLAQGARTVEGSAAARGTQLSGRTMADLQQLGMSTASQYRSQIMGELANLANIGSTSIGQAYGVGGQAMAQTAGAYSNLANLAQQTGQIQAANQLGTYGAITNLAGTLGSAYIKSQ